MPGTCTSMPYFAVPFAFSQDQKDVKEGG